MQKEFDDHYQRLLRRRRLLRRLLRPLPRRANVRRYPIIKWFADYARRVPYLWSFKRQNVLPALYAGSVLSLLPVYGAQLPLAVVVALLFRANLTITAALQFITNPFTILPVYGFTRWLGLKIMAATGIGHDLPWALAQADALFIGGVVAGLGTAALIHVGWLFAAWEARVFRARLHRLHAAVEAQRKSDSSSS